MAPRASARSRSPSLGEPVHHDHRPVGRRRTDYDEPLAIRVHVPVRREGWVIHTQIAGEHPRAGQLEAGIALPPRDLEQVIVAPIVEAPRVTRPPRPWAFGGHHCLALKPAVVVVRHLGPVGRRPVFSGQLVVRRRGEAASAECLPGRGYHPAPTNATGAAAPPRWALKIACCRSSSTRNGS